MAKLKLKALRVNKDLTLAEAAKSLGISNYALTNYEKGTSVLRVDVAFKMAKLYDVALDDIDFNLDANTIT